jgi:predicted PolB exonuclease-like 3'-5' exonuclease
MMTFPGDQEPIMNIVFDIETVPCQAPDFIASVQQPILEKLAMDIENIKHPANFKDHEKIDAWYAENLEKRTHELKESAKSEIDAAIAKTSFDGALGKICCIGWAIDDQPAFAKTGTEEEIIGTFFTDIMEKHDPSRDMYPVFIGHNVNSFDLRFLFQRAVINNIKPPRIIPFNAKSWDEHIFDTMTYFAGFGNRISLDKLSKALGLEGKKGITGADVWPMYKAGRIDEIAEYCKDDVDLTRQVYKRLTFADK